MVDEKEREEAKGGIMPEDTRQPAGSEPTGGAAEEGPPEPAADVAASPEAAAAQGSDDGAAKRGGGIRRWYGGHKVLTGVGIGVLAVALIVGVFFIGYAVGKPGNEPDRRVPVQQFQQPMQQDMQSMPSPGPGEAGPGRLDLLIDYREEIEDAIAAELGISSDELRDELEGGKTVEEIAEEKGISSEDLTAAVAAEMGRIADELAADGEITDEQAENMKSEAETLAQRFVRRGRQQHVPFE